MSAPIPAIQFFVSEVPERKKCAGILSRRAESLDFIAESTLSSKVGHVVHDAPVEKSVGVGKAATAFGTFGKQRSMRGIEVAVSVTECSD